MYLQGPLPALFSANTLNSYLQPVVRPSTHAFGFLSAYSATLPLFVLSW